jgi:hypothetical protein
MGATRTFAYVWILFFCVILLNGCKENNKKKEITQIVKEWHNKQVFLPNNLIFTIYGKDTVDYTIPESSYKILIYIDSIGCTSCKLQLHKWKEFISDVDSLTNGEVPVLFFFHPKDIGEISFLLKRDGIDVPVCLDLNDELNTLNLFPSNQEFQTFLLNDENKVIFIGNPIHNLRIKEMYLFEISNNEYHMKSAQSSQNTQIKVDKTEFDLGTINKEDVKTVSVSIKNCGQSPFFIFDTRASCGCTDITYEKKPISPDSTTEISITYNADDIGHFNKTVSVHGNVKDSPLIIRLKGNVK